MVLRFRLWTYEEHSRKTGPKIKHFPSTQFPCIPASHVGTAALGCPAEQSPAAFRTAVCHKTNKKQICHVTTETFKISALHRRSPMTRVVVAIFFFASTLFAQNVGTELLRHFDYDQKASLDIQEVGVQQRGTVAIHDISYASPKGGRVPTYLVVPKGKGPFAAVIWGHWYQDGSPFLNPKEFLAEAVARAPPREVSLLTAG